MELDEEFLVEEEPLWLRLIQAVVDITFSVAVGTGLLVVISAFGTVVCYLAFF